jgi:hypothetical protein
MPRFSSNCDVMYSGNASCPVFDTSLVMAVQGRKAFHVYILTEIHMFRNPQNAR